MVSLLCIISTVPLGRCCIHKHCMFNLFWYVHVHIFLSLQKPLMLQGHERAITQIKYNREGDLLFSSAKDVTPNVWYSLNGERLGTYNGHTGAVWCIDVDWKTSKFLSGAADNSLRLWDVATGNVIVFNAIRFVYNQTVYDL